MNKNKLNIIVAIVFSVLCFFVNPLFGFIVFLCSMIYVGVRNENNKSGHTDLNLNKEEINDFAKKPISLRFALLFVIFIILFVTVLVKLATQDIPTNEPNTSVTAAEKEDAQKQLDNIMSLGGQSGLVVSYEFSNSASVVYVGNMWNTQTVQFKKDFVAKIGILKEKIRGYKHFEVRNAYSNEKVAELTAFSGSVEIYK